MRRERSLPARASPRAPMAALLAIMMPAVVGAQTLAPESIFPGPLVVEALVADPLTAEATPAFGEIAAGLPRKQAFISFMAPMIDAQNAWILDNRELLEDARNHLLQDLDLDADTRHRILSLASHYELTTSSSAQTPSGDATLAAVSPAHSPHIDLALIDRLLFRGDVIPPSLAIAQAANESGWGTSRFAREGNNFFGEWCLTPGCGMVPGRRTTSARHEVESFDTVEDAVRSYFRTLNKAAAFRRLRELRAAARVRGAPLSGEDLAAGLHSYSAIGQDYIDSLLAIISSNQLGDRDAALLESVPAGSGSDAQGAATQDEGADGAAPPRQLPDRRP